MSLDNTCDHYQDNRAAYLFNHPRDLVDAGVMGVLFGGGAACMTGVEPMAALSALKARLPMPRRLPQRAGRQCRWRIDRLAALA